MRPAALLLAMGLVACSSHPPDTPTGRYLGTVTPVAPGPLCQPSKAVLQVRDTIVLFAPDEGTWVLNGIADPNGTLTADRASIGANKQPYATSLEAHWTPQSVTGTYKTPRCTFSVALSRP